MSSKKLFTVAEANALIPQLLKEIPEVRKQLRVLKTKFPDIQNAWKKAGNNGGSHQGAAYVQIATEVNFVLQSLENQGCLVKQVDKGLVDFPSIREGREVLLCWQYPENKIEYWHDLDAGFAGRQTI